LHPWIPREFAEATIDRNNRGDRAVRLVREHRAEYPSLTAASAAVARQVGVVTESTKPAAVPGLV
jgi:hypothetical protein